MGRLPLHFPHFISQHTAIKFLQHTAFPTNPQHTAPLHLKPQHTASLITISQHTAQPVISLTETRPNTRPEFEVFTPCHDNIKPSSTLIPNHWNELLRNYPDKTFVNNIVGMAIYGARLGYIGPVHSIESANHSSALRIPLDIETNLIEEIHAGRIIKVSQLPSHYISSPIGAVQKKQNGKFTGWRRIHDLSYPAGKSVNDGIPKHHGSLKYQTLDDAIRLIAKFGRGVVMHKCDLKDAFRKIPVSPFDLWLLLFR